MNISGNSILITGGATGIGFALAEAFMKAGNKVFICGRKISRLEDAKEKIPGLQIRRCNLSTREHRDSFCRWIRENFKDMNVLINNAGVQKGMNFKKGTADLFKGDDEVQTNFAAPVHLSAYFAPLLMKKKEAAIINVSSGLGFVPIAFMPVYCATKAAIHSFTVSLRHQLKDTPVKVFELIPPAVDTGLGKGSTGDSEEHRGIPASEVADAMLDAFKEDRYEVTVGESAGLVERSKTDFVKAFRDLNSW